MPLHPIVVHFPIALAVLTPAFALLLLGGWWAGWWSRRTWAVAALMAALLTASSFVAMRTGEAEEERVEETVPESAIHRHEERAEVFTWFTLLPLALALGGLLIRKEEAARWAAAGATGTLVASAALAWGVGHAGGEIVYRHGIPTLAAGEVVSQVSWLGGEQEEEEDDDDDD